MAIFEDHEIKPFLSYLDPGNKGYLNFREFSDKVRSGMTVQNEMGASTVYPYT